MSSDAFTRDLIEMARSHVDNGRQDEARALLRGSLAPDMEFATLVRLVKWSKTVHWTDLNPLRLALLGGGTLDQLADALGFWLLLDGYRLEKYVPPFATWKMECLNPQSELYRFEPEIVWFFTHWRDIDLGDAPEANEDDAGRIAIAAMDELKGLWEHVRTGLPKAQIIQNNIDPARSNVFGNFAAMLPGSAVSLSRFFNLNLPAKAMERNVQVFDLERVATEAGLERWRGLSYWFYSKHPFSPELSGLAAFKAARFLAAGKGAAKKAIALDLDDTLWGGVVGDDGIEGIRLGLGVDGEAYAAFQEYLKRLSERGVLLVVISKNDEETARHAFANHPNMRLSPNDVGVFLANWRNKADNLREAAKILNLGLDSFVFLDDNPAERQLIRSELPMVAVPELPRDASEYVPFLERMAYFETAAFSGEDRGRMKGYADNARRAAYRSTTTDLDKYLEGLEMAASLGEADASSLPRMAQLINKSNQFHLTTTRYPESELRFFSESGDHRLLWFSLRDRFGDHGIVSAVVLRREGDAFVIDTWVMSCRVLERGFESFIMEHLLRLAEKNRISRLIGIYLPSGRNNIVATLYRKLGFREISRENGAAEWELRTAEGLAEDARKHFIALLNG